MSAKIEKAAEIIKNARRVCAFSGAGISVESGIPPFRGEKGLWNTYDPIFIEINFFRRHPRDSWELIKKIFYDFFGQARPNMAHIVLAEMEQKDLLQHVITQNIDSLHQEAGSKNVSEFHGNYRKLICLDCSTRFDVSQISFEHLPPQCNRCKGLLKPDFVFFGEAIPEMASNRSFAEVEQSDVIIIVGSSGEVMPAASIPPMARDNGATIIEINPQPSNYTQTVSDVFLQGKATSIFRKLAKKLDIGTE